MARPGGAIHPFCEPVMTTSNPHSSIGQGREPRLETASTMRSLSRCLTTCAISCRGLVMPVDVSLWVMNTVVTSGLASRDAATDSAVAACPHSTCCQRTSAPNVSAIRPIRVPNAPISMARTGSWGESVLTTAASSPPEPDDVSIRTSFFVSNSCCKRVLTRS